MTDAPDTTTTGGAVAGALTFLGGIGLWLKRSANEKEANAEFMKTTTKKVDDMQVQIREVSATADRIQSGVNAMVAIMEKLADNSKEITRLTGVLVERDDDRQKDELRRLKDKLDRLGGEP